MTRETLVLGLLLGALATGCKPVKEVLDDLPDGSVPEIPEVELPDFRLPKDGAGLYELIQVAGSKIQLDPTKNDPLSAVGRCADLVTSCYEDGQPLDACVSGTRRCQTAEPWKEDEDCCPTACADAYASARGGGAAPFSAFEESFFLSPGCFPGVLEAVGGQP